MKVGILGDGAMAMAISYLLKNNNIVHTVFSRKLGNISQIVECSLVFFCVPSSAILEIAPLLQNTNIVSCAKGVGTNAKPFISSLFDENKFCVLSGPNFANEIIENHSTITTIASKNIELIDTVKQLVLSNNLILEETQNVHGVEICGIIKNVIAIAMGYASERIPSWNTKALILTQMFQEMAAILKHFNCNTDVLQLSCGIGDIFLTCSTTNSRNFRLGVDIAKNNHKIWSPQNKEHIENTAKYTANTTNITVEGIRSAQFLQNLKIHIPTIHSFIRYL